MKGRKKKNAGFSMIEIIVVVAIIAVFVGTLAPSLIRYVKKARRVKDVNSAEEIRAAFERAIEDSERGTNINNYRYTCTVIFNQNSGINRTNPNIVDEAMIAMGGRAPASALNSKYWWEVSYNPKNGEVKSIYLVDGPAEKIKYELYPNSDNFVKYGK